LKGKKESPEYVLMMLMCVCVCVCMRVCVRGVILLRNRKRSYY